MDIIKGIAMFEIIKIIFFIGFVILLMVGITITKIVVDNKKFLSTNDGDIKSNYDGSFTQTINYTVNNKNYTKTITPVIKSKTDPVTKIITDTKGFKYAECNKGECLLFYESSNPDNYNVNRDPSELVKAIIKLIFFISIFFGSFILLFLFMNLLIAIHNKNATGVMGAVNILKNIT